VLSSLRLEKHPDKTFIGRIEKGFDFLGYHFGPAGLKLAKQTLANFIEKPSRLYEQERQEPDGSCPLEMYFRRWRSWTRAGLERTATSRQSKRRNPGKPMTICGACAGTPA
jgi:hypothetical protein